MPFGQSCNNYKNWAEYMDKVYGIDNLESMTVTIMCMTHKYY